MRRHLRAVEDDNLCVLCHQHTYEDHQHLFFSCNFSAEFGTICRLTGLVAPMFINAFLWPGRDLLKPSSLRWSSRRLGIFGYFEMAGPLEGKELPLVFGVVNLYMI